MPEIVQRFVSEILQARPAPPRQTQSVQTGALRDRIAVRGPAAAAVGRSVLARVSGGRCSGWRTYMRPIARRPEGARGCCEGAVLREPVLPGQRPHALASFGAAFCRLGGSVCDTTGFTFSSMAKGESIYDTSRVMSGYVDALVVRHPEQGSVAEFARDQHPGDQRRRRRGRAPEPGAARPLHDPARVLAPRAHRRRCAYRLRRRPEVRAHGAFVVKLLSLYRGLKFTLIVARGARTPAAPWPSRISRNGHVVVQTASLAEGLARRRCGVRHAHPERSASSRRSRSSSRAARPTSRSIRR